MICVTHHACKCIQVERDKLHAEVAWLRGRAGDQINKRVKAEGAAIDARAEADRLREAVEQAHGLIQTASSRARILRARDVLAAALGEKDSSA